MEPSKKDHRRSSTECKENFRDDLNHHPNLAVAGDCPKYLRTILVLINQTRLGFEDLIESSEGDKCSASRIYDEEMMRRAEEMSRACSTRGLNEVSESQWQEVMSRHAFLSLNSSEEEKTNNDRQYHHW